MEPDTYFFKIIAMTLTAVKVAQNYRPMGRNSPNLVTLIMRGTLVPLHFLSKNIISK
jgi:hypothetical protein